MLQLAYFTLADVNDVNMLLSPLMGMKALNGLNINMNSTGTGAVPQRVQAIGYSSNFISNCNIMLLVLIIEGAIGVGLYIVVRLAKNASITLYRIASKLLKEVLLTLVLFNCFNLAFSAGLHFVYAEKDDPLYVIGCVAAVFSLVLMMAMGLGLLAA